MSITIPQGGTVGGRSADIRGLDQQPDIGGFVSQVADQVARKQGEINQKRRAVQVEQTQLEMTKELGQERLRFEQMTDPDQIDTEWPEVEARIRDKYVNQVDENGKPRFNEDEAAHLGLTFQGLTMKHSLALGERTVKLTQSQQTAAWLEARTDIANQAATADPDTMAALIEFGEAAIDRRVSQGIILPDQAVKEKQEFRAEVMNARLTTAIANDPETALADLGAGTYDALGAEKVAQRKVAAQAELDRIAAADAKLVEADQKKRSDAIGRRLDTIATLKGKGRLVVDEDYIDDPEVMAHENYPKAKAAVELAREIPDLNLKTVAELDALIAAERDRPITETWENERLTVLEALREDRAKGYATDPKATAAEAGLIEAPPLEFDPADPEAFAGALADSISTDAHLREKGYTRQGAIFSRDEKAALKAVIDPAADADAKVNLAWAILEGSGGNVAPVLAELEADPVFRRGVKLLGLTGDAELVKSVLRGQQKMEGTTAVLPSRKEQILAFDALTGGSFDDQPRLKEELMAATLALFADNAAGIDAETTAKSGWISDGEAYELYAQSVQRLLGAQPDRNGNLTVGGLQEVNGGLTILPVGVSVAEAEASWDAIGNQLRGLDAMPDWASMEADLQAQMANPDQPRQPGPDKLRAFRSASVYGGLPDLGSNPAARWNTLQLQRVGETDVYELVYLQGGRLIPVTEQGKDHAYRFRLKDLMRGARQ